MSVSSSRCPTCNGKVRWWPGSVQQWLFGRRTCRGCGATLKMKNANLAAALLGIVAGGLVVSAVHLTFGSYLLRLSLAVVLCWAVSVPILALVVQWRVVEADEPDAREGRN